MRLAVSAVKTSMPAMAHAHWLMKSEPDVFGIDDLRAKGTAPWDGVRNFQARNFLQAMKAGDRVLFHHSSAKPTGIAGLATVVRAAYPDHTAWDPKSAYFDAKSTAEKPRWFMVDVRYERTFPRVLTIDELRAVPELRGMVLLNNTRLSVQPVTPEEFRIVVKMAGTLKQAESKNHSP
jgi:predicted RNA-binding protein with PUA-like domain